MTLNDLKNGNCAVITELAGGRDFKNRLASFGITKGAKFTVKAVTIMRNVFEIEVQDGTCVALRRGEAQKIQVELCKK
jgi:Fe2+ transport system protein FeoA